MFIKSFIIILFCASVNSLKLKQVVVFSRHNVRTPLITNLEAFTEKKWPTWDVKSGHLTERGGQLERSMGKYFSDWLIDEKLLQNNCPTEEAYVYSNTRQRTKETAQAFASGAFGDCVTVYFKNITEMDPIFNPVIRNDTAEFKELVFSEMQKKIDGISLKEAYEELERILDLDNSSLCRVENVCDLSKIRNDVVYILNQEPDVSGALMIANSVVDAFLMAYYDGKSSDEVAWGELTTLKQWNTLMPAVKAYHDLRFKTKALSKDLASTLLEYMTDIFLNGEKKFYLLVGHDSNINSLTAAMNFKDYDLHDQIENTPIGGKLVFQKWYDEVNDQDLLRVNYVYRSTQQMRDGDVLSLENPPQWARMQIENCDVYVDDFCLWQDFVKVLKSL